MNSENDIKSTIDNIFGSLEKFIQSKTVVGEPIEIGDIKMIPLIDITFGLGSSFANGKDQESKQGNLGSAGSGGKISTSAVLIIRGDTVDLLPVKKSANLEKLIEMIPDTVDKFKKEEEEG